MGKVIAAYGGGFKPPTGGHFQIVKNALAEFPEIDEFIIYVGSKERDGIDQAEAILVWEIYQNYLANKVTIKPSQSPIGDILRLAKDNPQDEIYFVIGYREGRDDDMKDVTSRTSNLEEKYPNIKVITMSTTDTNMSGTNARKAIGNEEEFIKFLPPEVKEKSEIWNIIRPVATESINENASYSQNIDYKQLIADLTDYMVKKGRNIEPLPKVEFVDGDTENAKDFFGKTAYYDPATQTIVLYTEGRHPKDIVRSYSHEMVHHTQNLEDRLEGITTTNTMEDDKLDKIEQEANLVGTMTFRNWTDTINEAIVGDKIECDECGWNWKIKDGGDDLFVCHKCGHDNELVLNEFSLPKFDVVKPIIDKFLGGVEKAGQKLLNIVKREGKQTLALVKEIAEYVIKGEKPNATEQKKITKQLLDLGAIAAFGISGGIPVSAFSILYWVIQESGMAKEFFKLDESFKEDKDYFGLNALVREIVEEPKYKIFSDMDGVLTDFDESFKKASDGIAPRDYEKKFGKDKFWELIDGGGVGYWVGMPYMPDGERYWDYIKGYDVELLSSPSRSNTSRLGKRLWVRNNMPGVKLTLAQAYLKKNYAAPNHILIDDRKSNIDEWRAAGGIGILHTSASDTIRQLKKLGL